MITKLGKTVMGGLAAVLFGLAATPAIGQISDQQLRSVEDRLRALEEQFVLRANPALTVGERMTVDYGAVVNVSFLAIDDDAQNTRILRQTDGRLYGRVSVDGVHNFFGRLRFLYQDFDTGDSFRGDGDRFQNPIGDRYWYGFDYRRAVEAYEGRYTDWNFTLQVGLQYVSWASGLTYSDELYALRLTAEHSDYLQWEGLVGQTPNNFVVDFDSTRPDFDENTKRYLIGNKLTLLTFEEHRPYVYYLIQRDDNDTGFTNVVAGPVFPTYLNYDSEYLGAGSTGQLLPKLFYEVEGVYQTGEGLSNSFVTGVGGVPVAAPQTTEDIEAWALRSELRYLFYDDARTRLEFETLFASGDSDRTFDTSNTFGGNTPGTNDNAFNSFGFANTGLAFAAPLSNLAMFRLGASTYPLHNSEMFKELQVGIDFFMFNKLNSEAPIDEATKDLNHLGVEVDLFANWRVTSDLGVFVRYGVFAPGPAIIADKDERHYFFTGITYSF